MLTTVVQRYLPIFVFLVPLVLPLVLASQPDQAMRARDSNDLNTTMDGAMALDSGNMLTYLHFTVGGDTLWFLGWVPIGPGPMFGACFGLFLLALIDRWIAGCRGMMELHWAKRAEIIYANKLNANGNGKGNSDAKNGVPPATLGNVLLMRRAPPFIPAHDFVRGIMHIGQAALTFWFMLAVMTFQVGFILSIVIGLGVGETLFGRFARAGSGGLH